MRQGTARLWRRLRFTILVALAAWSGAASAQTYHIDRSAAARAAEGVQLGEFFTEIISRAGYASVRELGFGNSIRDGRYVAPGDLFDVLLPRLGTGRVDVYQGTPARRPDGSPAVTHVRFRDKAGWLAVVVATRIPGESGAEAGVLQAVERAQRELYAHVDTAAIDFVHVDGPWGPGLEIVVRNRIADPFFPYGAAKIQSSDRLESLGVNRFVVRDGVLFEFGVVVPRPADMSAAAFSAFARDATDRFMSGLGPR